MKMIRLYFRLKNWSFEPKMTEMARTSQISSKLLYYYGVEGRVDVFV